MTETSATGPLKWMSDTAFDLDFQRLKSQLIQLDAFDGDPGPHTPLRVDVVPEQLLRIWKALVDHGVGRGLL